MSDIFKPTDEQVAVIESDSPRLTVSAAAGAGKTAVLVARYLRLVEGGTPPDAILTITFTKKAAAEMKKRIVRELRRRGKLREAQTAETGPIQTIHSFCERLLRENSLEAGLDPKFEICGDSEAGTMLERAIRDTLTMDLTEFPEAERLISYLAGLRTFRGGRSPYSKLEEAIRETLGKLRGTGLTLGDLQESYTSTRGLRALFESAMFSGLSPAVQSCLPPQGAITERIEIACAEAGEKMPRWAKAKFDADANEEALSHTAGLFQLAAHAWAIFEHEMIREQQLDFTLLESHAVHLLEHSSATKERLAQQYRVVMVDEAQDVNPIQHRLLSTMGIASQMIVGDAQQSIYGFRLADPELFRQRTKELSALRLTENKRSDAGILRFVDLVFGRLWAEYHPMQPPAPPLELDVVELPFYQGVELWPIVSRDCKLVATCIKRMVEEEAVPLGDIAVLVRKAAYALDMRRELEDAGIRCRIAGGSERFYTRLEVRDLANTLRSLADPYDDFALLATLRSPLAGISLDSIALLGNAKPVVEALKSFVPPVEDDVIKLERFLSWFNPLRSFADRLSAWEVLSELFAVSDYLPSLARRGDAPQLLANVRKLLVLAAAEPELGPLDYAERIREIQNLRHREGDAPSDDENEDLVTIMTIHKAKGLEWPVVVVPEMHEKLVKSPGDLEIDARLKLAASKFGKKPSVYHTWLYEGRKEREVEEELRLMYVAFTRAKKRLCVIAHPSAKQGSLAQRLASAIGFGKTPPAGFYLRDCGGAEEDSETLGEW